MPVGPLGLDSLVASDPLILQWGGGEGHDGQIWGFRTL